MKIMKKHFSKITLGLGLVLASAVNSFAAFTLPTLPVTDLEAAGTAVAALVAVYVIIRMAIGMIKRA
jgi:hypothetical protein